MAELDPIQVDDYCYYAEFAMGILTGLAVLKEDKDMGLPSPMVNDYNNIEDNALKILRISLQRLSDLPDFTEVKKKREK